MKTPLALLVLLAACVKEGDSSARPGPGTTTTPGTPSATGLPSGTPATGSTTASGTPSTTSPAPWDCAPLPIPAGNQVRVPAGDVTALRSAVDSARTGDVILLADGSWSLNGVFLWIDTPGVTLRGESGDSSAVILDGTSNTTEIITIAADDVTVAHLTAANAYTHGIHATGGADADVSGTVIYDVRVIDPGEQAIKINQTGDGRWTDDGLVACSHLELTDVGRPRIRNNCYTGGIDAHATRGWTIRDNHVEGFWCEAGLSEHGIHLWRKNAETLIERNTVVDCARGIGLGLSTSPGAFDRDHGIACGPDYVDDIRGTVRNNTVFVQDSRIYGSASGYDQGIGIWNACEAVVVQNTVYSTQAPFSSIEWRFDPTTAHIGNNLVNHPTRERTAGIATVEGNLESADGSWFVDAAGGDLHLAGAAPAIDAGVALGTDAPTGDLDGDPRTGTPDVGADER